jgi:hypothetical protein
MLVHDKNIKDQNFSLIHTMDLTWNLSLTGEYYQYEVYVPCNLWNC